MGRVTRRLPRSRLDRASGSWCVVRRPDPVVVEEPLTIRVGGRVVGTTMRTPGDDFDLAIGHLLTEGLVRPEDVAHAMHCLDVDEQGSATFNVVDVTLRPGASLLRDPDVRTEPASSACGVCGKQAIDELLTRTTAALTGPALSADVVPELLGRMRSAQSIHDRTGGAHAAALGTPAGEVLVVREDVGRHNAVDKVVGAQTRSGMPISADHVLVVSSRAGFEIVQKAVGVGIPTVVAAGAPTSLAVELAEATGVLLLAFARDESLAVYSHADRLVVPTD